MRKQLMLLLFSLFAVLGYARTVTGVVTQASDGDVIIGASIQVHGTTRGTVTDFDGKYSIDVKDGDVLDVSYVGMNPVSIKVTPDKDVINIEMKENSQVLGEVVVTAMGQTQEKKKLNFAVQQLNSDQVTAGSSANFASSLQGKVAGLQVGTGGGSPNSSTQVIIRAISSVNNSQSNEPLIIIDGIAMKSSSASSLADINPNDIENMSVLKGAAASALYGQEAANGVIMITTKSGSKDGTINVTASASVEISNAMRVPKLQSLYAPGSKGMYKENSASGGWGPYIAPGETVYDNLGGFLGTGIQQKYDGSISGGTEKFNSYASVSYMDSEGIVPKDYKKQFTAFLKSSFNPSKQINFQLSMNFTDTQSRGFGNSMSSIYAWGINKDMKDYQTLEGHVNWRARYDHWDDMLDIERINCGSSPYFGRYNDKSLTKSNHFVVNGQLSYTPIEDLVFTGRVGYDKSYSSYDAYTVPRFYDGDLRDPKAEEIVQALSSNQDVYGSYSFQPSHSQMVNMQGLVTYKKTFAEDFTFNALFGMEYKKGNSWSSSIYGENFQLGGDFYSFMNTNFNDGDLLKTNRPTLYHTAYDKYGYFGELRFDYKGMAQLSATYRHDGSSRFKQAPETSYNYPSITAGVIFSELFHLQN
ncbi:MAG: SusC/RagA family TonB-linked outer membrane protein, partial [Muribaculaceae bacterium]|nr:SusC/RagA family TonB-linked outer membrane protein [Muribaculaceae bacterium]